MIQLACSCSDAGGSNGVHLHVVGRAQDGISGAHSMLLLILRIVPSAPLWSSKISGERKIF